MAGWNNPLECAFPDLFSLEDRPEFPLLDAPDTGIRINVDGLDYDGTTLVFNLLVAYSFPRSFIDCFARVDWAMVLTVEDVESGRGLAINLIDPHKRYDDQADINYTPGEVESEPTSFMGSFVEVPMAIKIAQPESAPSVFLTVTLQQHNSNTLGLDLLEIKAINYMDGQPADLPLLGEEEEEEEAEEELEDDSAD